jgi:hypothetical protein
MSVQTAYIQGATAGDASAKLSNWFKNFDSRCGSCRSYCTRMAIGGGSLRSSTFEKDRNAVDVKRQNVKIIPPDWLPDKHKCVVILARMGPLDDDGWAEHYYEAAVVPADSKPDRMKFLSNYGNNEAEA